MPYEDETCEGCLYAPDMIKIDGCKVHDLPVGQRKCDLFELNLYAREVRALETIAGCVEPYCVGGPGVAPADPFLRCGKP
jgi:hypothetical protein